MLKIIVLVPLILCVLWIIYLRLNKFTFEQGKQGFLYILIISSVIAAFYSMMLFLTH